MGKSKERVNTICEVLKEMIEFIIDDSAGDDEDLGGGDTQNLEAPFSIEVNDSVTAKMLLKRQKQKLMRELRVIESCVQILHLPFALKIFRF